MPGGTGILAHGDQIRLNKCIYISMLQDILPPGTGLAQPVPEPMKKQPTSLLSSPEPLGAHQALAAAVIRQALVDAAAPASSDRLRANAQAFLAGSSMLRQWCLVAGLDLGCVEREYDAYRALMQRPTPAARVAASVRQQSSRVRTSPRFAVHAGR